MLDVKQVCLLAVATVAFVGLTGCVERRITIGSDPPGALLVMNDVEVGRTPVTVPFTWDGDYDLKFRLEKSEGPEEKRVIRRWYLHTHKKTTTPVYEFIGLDLLAELLPFRFKDEQVWAFPVPEVQAPTDEELINRARGMQESLPEPARK